MFFNLAKRKKKKKKSFEELDPKYLHLILQTFKTKKFPIKKFDIFKE